MKKNLFYLGFILVFCGCGNMNEYYSANEIILKNHYKDPAGNCIIYSIPLETLYYSSGYDISYNNDSSEATLGFIRQRINTRFSGSLKSEFIRQNDQLNYLIRLPRKVENVYTRGKDGTRFLVNFPG
jgi:hypothetical protein